jgi:hypothetical protein
MPHITSASAIGTLATLILLLATSSRAQEGIVYSDFQTVGGITYAFLRCEIGDCNSLNPAHATRTGNLITQAMPLRGAAFCECLVDPCPTHTEFAICPLGPLSAGAYALSLQFSRIGALPGPSFILNFNVPEHEARTIIASRETNSLRLDIQGISYCYYTVEKSTDLVNWGDPYTHAGAPFTFHDTLPGDQSVRFYRVRIDPNVLRNPVIIWNPD